MGTKSHRRESDTSAPRIVHEPKNGRLALRRLVHEESYSHIQRISEALDESGEILNQETQRGMLYVPRYCRLTIFSTEELPRGKKHRTADVVRRVPRCSENLGVQLGGFIISTTGSEKPRLALEVLSSRAEEERDLIRATFEKKDLKLREIMDENGEIRRLHLTMATIDREHEEYFDEDKRMELNLLAGATVTDAGVDMGKILLRHVSMPRF